MEREERAQRVTKGDQEGAKRPTRAARGVPEATRKKLALLGLWNDLARELRGSEAKDTPVNRGHAGRLLEACRDDRKVFEHRARKFLNQSWRTYRRLGDLYRAWETLGDPRGDSFDSKSAKVPEEPEGVNWRGYFKRPAWWDDPKNLTPEEIKAKARSILSKLRG